MFPTAPADTSTNLNLITITPAVNPQTLTPQTSPLSTASDSAASDLVLATRETNNSPWEDGEVYPDSSESLKDHTSPEFKDAASHTSTSKVSESDSFEVIKAAAVSGDPIAQFYLGQRYEEGKDVEQDNRQAFYWYKQAAEQGDVYAQFNVGNMYYSGRGVEGDDDQSFIWFRKAAEQGDADAQLNVGFMYENGEGVEEDQKQAFIWYLKAAEQGLADAQFTVGAKYKKGEGVKADKSQAFIWYLKAAEQGHADAQFTVGAKYKKGEGVEADQRQAFIWYLKAAEQGHADAQRNVGAKYKKGEGVKCDEGEAFIWFYKAAKNGSYSAQVALASAYLQGQGVKKDVLQATYWLLKSGLKSHGEKINLICDRSWGNLFGEVISHIPKVLSNFPEFQNVKALKLLDGLADDEYSILVDMIRSNPLLKKLNLSSQAFDDERVRMLVDSLQFNTTLTELIIVDEDDELDKNLSDQIHVSLAQNIAIAELREYMKQHPASRSDHLPLEVLNMMIDKLIVTSVKGGQSKAATIAAINEFLLSASRETLEAEKHRQ